jgi:nucleoid-associated protein YgaU
MTNRLNQFLRATGALVALSVLLLGVPTALITLVGNPTPAGIPSWAEVQQAIEVGDVQASTWIKASAWVAWGLWAHFAIGVVAEVPTAIGRSRSRLGSRTRAGHWAARRLIGQLTLSAALLTHTATATGAGALAEQSTTVIQPPDADPDPGQSAHARWGPVAADPAANMDDVETRTVTVERGGTLWDLAVTHLGDGERWPEIRDANIGSQQDDGTILADGFTRIRAGWRLAIPTTPDAEAPLAEDTWIVQPGEHLWGISESLLTEGGETPGEREVADYWLALIEANHDRLPDPDNSDLLYAGDELRVPASSTRTEIADPNKPAVAPSPAVPDRPEQPAAIPAETAEPAASAPTNELDVVIEEVGETGEADETQAASLDGPGWGLSLFGVAGTAVGAAGIVVALREHRRRQARQRQPGELPIDPPVVAAETERQIRPIAEHDAYRWIAATNRYLAHQLAADPALVLPDVLAVRAGTWGAELLLETPCQTVNGFGADAATPDVWTLNSELELQDIEDAPDGHPYSPALATVGTTPGGDLLIDLERLGCISVRGTSSDVQGWYRSIVVSLTTATWAREVDIVAIDVDLGELGTRVTVPADPDHWCEAAIGRVRAEAASMTMSPYEERIRYGDVHPPTIVLIGPGRPELGRKLAELTELAWSPFAMLTTAAIRDVHSITLEERTATLEPAGLTFAPAYTPLEVSDDVTALVDSAERLPDAFAAQAEAQLFEPVSNGLTSDEIAMQPDVEPDACIAEEMTAPGRPERGYEDSADLDVLSAPDDPKGDDPTVPVERPATPTVDFTTEITEQVRAIMEPRPVEVRILTPIPAIDGIDDKVTLKQQGIIAYLAYTRTVTGDRLRDVFWPNSTNRATCDNMLARIRKQLGATIDGEARFRFDRTTGRHMVNDDIGCDWHRVDQLLTLAKDCSGPDEVQVLASAVGLIDGPAGLDAHRRHFSWLCDDQLVFAVIETVLVDAAHRLGQAALALGDPGLAKWAAEKGLRLVPGHEALLRIVMQGCAAVGDSQGVEDAYRAAVASAEDGAFFDQVHGETEALFRETVG